MPLTADDAWTRLRAVFTDLFGDDVVVGPTTTADDVEEWDSVRNVELLVAIEQEFGMRFRSGEVSSLQNVGELLQLVIERSG